ncbi:MAG TPA: NlpC/P60 family protein, partial [Ilumatobacteraceae bacterium]|nr:NlpC/P60 family protein [Ilumatobacteraceae bacterium]
SVDQQRQKVEDIVDELERLEERALVLGEDYVEAIDTKGLLDVEIADAQARIAEQEAELNQLRASLGDMALRSFVGGGAKPLGPLFEDSENLNDAVRREELARVALSAGDVTTDELDALVADINDEKDVLDRKREEADQLAASLTDAQAETDRLTQEYTQARADAEATLGELVAQEEQRRAEESARRVREEAAAAAATASSSDSTSGGNSTSGGSSSSGGTSSSGGSSTSGGGGSAATSSGGGTAAPASAPAVSSRAGIAVQAALAQQGVPYRYATSIPGVGFDCSGLTGYAWEQAGVGLPHQSGMQFASTPRVPISEAQAGDLLFFYSPISHVSIYLGNGTHVHAPNTGSVVNVSSVNWGKVVGVGRPG